MKFNETKTRVTSKELERRSSGSSRLSVLNENRSEITYLSINQLHPYKKQARKIFDASEIETLAETIKEHGIRQPLTVLRVESEAVFFEVISGERRLRAAKLLGIEKVPCIIIDNQEKADEIALMENVQRQDLHPIEIARALKMLIDKLGWGGQTELKSKVGLSNSQVSELIKLNTLSMEVQDLILETNFRGRENLRKLFSLKGEGSQVSFIKSNIEKKAADNRVQRKSFISTSVFRIAFQNDKIRIQKAGLSKLTNIQKQQVREQLLDILKEIS